MTDPHDRPYTFGAQGQIVRREDAQRAADAQAEHDRAIAEAAWDEYLQAIAEAAWDEYLQPPPEGRRPVSHCAQPNPCPAGGCPCGDEMRAETETTRETR